MGAQASKTGAAASATVAKRAAAETPVVIRTNLTREDVAVMASRLVLGASAPADGVSGVQRPGNLQPQQEIVEMQDELLQHAQRFDDFGKVEYLAVSASLSPVLVYYRGSEALTNQDWRSAGDDQGV